MTESLYNDNIKPIDFSGALLIPRWGHEQPHLPVIEYCLDNLKFDGLITEFGVWTGISANFIAKKIAPKILHAFDSFKGLEVKWNGLDERFFVVDKSELVFEKNVDLHPGYFIATIPDLYSLNSSISFINIDCDLYESTKTVLFDLNNLVKVGTIIYFDELYNYPEYKEHEYKALLEWCDKKDRDYKIIAYNDVMGVAIEVTK